MIFEILSKITLDIIRYLSIFVKSRPLQDFDIIRYLYRLLTGFVGIVNLSYWLSAHYKIVHRKIKILHWQIGIPTDFTYRLHSKFTRLRAVTDFEQIMSQLLRNQLKLPEISWAVSHKPEKLTQLRRSSQIIKIPVCNRINFLANSLIPRHSRHKYLLPVKGLAAYKEIKGYLPMLHHLWGNSHISSISSILKMTLPMWVVALSWKCP